jgi:predicted transcriptional regulator
MMLVLKKCMTQPAEPPTCDTTIAQAMAKKGYMNRKRGRRRKNYSIKTTKGQKFTIHHYRYVFIP